MKLKIFLLSVFYFSLFTFYCFGQVNLNIRLVTSSGTPRTGQAANIAFTKYPHSYPGDVVAGLTITEVGTAGNYTCRGFSTFQYVYLWVSGTRETWFDSTLTGDLKAYLLANYMTIATDQTVSGVKTYSTAPKSTDAANATTEIMRYDEALRTTGNQTKSTGVLTFQDNYPTMGWTATYTDPTSADQLTPKKYVDDLYAGVSGMIQSTYMIRCIPTRTTEDRFSKPTLEKCYSYLAALTSISSFRGVIVIEPVALANNQINADDGTTAWVANGIDYFSFNKVRINRRAPNSSITSDSRLTNLWIYNNILDNDKTYVNMTFVNCDFSCIDNQVTFTSCKFLGVCRVYSSVAVVLSNCTGTAVWINDDLSSVTITGTQPIDVRTVNKTDLGF